MNTYQLERRRVRSATKRLPLVARPLGRAASTCYIGLDLLILFFSLWGAYLLRIQPNVLRFALDMGDTNAPLTPKEYWGVFLLLAALMVLCFHGLGLYRRRILNLWKVCAQVAVGVTGAAVVVMAAFYLAHIGEDVSRFVMLGTWGFALTGLTGVRLLQHGWERTHLAQSSHRALVVGGGTVGWSLAQTLQRHPLLGYQVVGVVDDGVDSPQVLGTVAEVPRLLPKHFIEVVFITLPFEREVVQNVTLAARRLGIQVKLIPDLYDGLLRKTQLSHLGELPVLELFRPPIPEWGLLVKRLMDLAGGVAGLVIGAPLMAAIALAIKLDDGGPVLYRAKRVGRKGHTFTCYKFRTMVPNADELKDQLRHLNERVGPMFKITDDPRLTRVGRFLRKYSLDEWPQFWNVFKGEMSLVGPRPPTPDEVEKYERFKLDYYRRLDVKPGMTSPWAVEAQRDPDFERAVALDIYYIENWGLLLDIKILLRTIVTVLRGVGK